MKNFLCLIAALSLSVLTVGCGGGVPEDAPPAEAAGEDAVDAQLEESGVSEADYEAEMQKAMQESGGNEGAEE